LYLQYTNLRELITIYEPFINFCELIGHDEKVKKLKSELALCLKRKDSVENIIDAKKDKIIEKGK